MYVHSSVRASVPPSLHSSVCLSVRTSARVPILSAYDMKRALKLVCVKQFLHMPACSCIKNDGSQYLVDMISRGKMECCGDSVEGIDYGEILFIEALTSIEAAFCTIEVDFLCKYS